MALSSSFPPRDYVGYGENPPNPNWPNGAKVAVSFVFNYEEGAEMSITEGDKGAEFLLNEIPGTAPLLNKRNPNVESLYEYGSRAGCWRVIRAFADKKLALTVYACGQALERNPEAAHAMHKAGFEMASHGYRWLDYAEVPIEVERTHIRKTIEVHQNLFGAPPRGFYQGKPSAKTRELVLEFPNFEYDNDVYNDDLPYWNYFYSRPLLMIPYSLDCNDMKFVAPNGSPYSSENFFNYMKDTYQCLLEESTNSPKMMSIGLHARIVGRPGRIMGLKRFLDYIADQQEKGNAWVCTRGSIADHWIKNFPAKQA